MSDAVNWDEVEEASALLPIGVYKVRVANSEVRVSKANNTMWNLSLTVLEGDKKGRIINDRLVWVAGALPRVKKALLSLGVKLSNDKMLAQYIVGKVGWVLVDHREFMGMTKAEIPFDGWLYEADVEDAKLRIPTMVARAAVMASSIATATKDLKYSDADTPF